MKKLGLIHALLLFSTLLTAQSVRRVNCLVGSDVETAKPLVATAGLFSSEDTYRQLVILVSFADCDFLPDDSLEYYQRMFNEVGFVQRKGAGSVADYFRVQSNGRLNLAFDVYGPVKIDMPAASGNGTDPNWGRQEFLEALRVFSAQYPDIDYSPYDWNGDGFLEQVIFVYAGYVGNQAGQTKHIWPSTGNFSTFTTTDGHHITRYTCSGELWSNNTSCGIGTICHEFSHCLGLPDIYPTSSAVSYTAVVDEWDLMDSGNMSNMGSCPPNYSPIEKMQMGWLEPVELTKDTVITNLKPVTEGGETFIIHHTANEYYLLENRQWEGWDAALPGRGLVIWHVNYKYYNWENNTVNNTEGRPDCHLMAADNLDYTEWVDLHIARGSGNPYQDRTNRMNKILMSTAAYPWTTDSTSFVNNSLTDFSMPASEMYNRNSEGNYLLSKPITDITQHVDGTVSFAFHTSNNPDGIVNIETTYTQDTVYDLCGKRMANASQLLPGIYIVNGKKRIISRR